MACSKHNLCEDLLIEIMTKLPSKSLFRSKCVSKTWNHLISSDHVQKKLPFTISGIYSNLSTENSKLQYSCISNGKFIDINLSFFPLHSKSRIIGCCNGLLLCQSLFSELLHVCNPTTKRWFTLPNSNKPSLLSVLTFDPSRSSHYRVICFVGWQKQGAKLEVFLSETGNWVEHNVHWGVESSTMSPIMTYFNGNLHIVSCPHCILCIHLETMECQRVELPEPAKNGAHLGNNGGRLCYYSGNDDNKLSIWTLENRLDTNKWVLKHNISLKSIAVGSIRFLAFHPELEMVYFLIEGKLVSYDMSNKRIEEVGDFGGEMERCYLGQIWLFQFSNCVSDCLLKEKQ